ncbi:bifunctional nitrate reductase/sulfite reductase flavoprotein subunit alpha [Pseudomonas nunensis]|uniref:Bifunctional nitrate reductase/sulfite reductase flavoprotein subunit alpha n=1 Tax=Pseudomonas nunensis TaxID=2961896 RepID=A0ABY5EKT8_9PSED|nr:bifunctional nitrate reductase/sulfite reductase flavoprotein subunit alpha [Pseudomonas nunensis]KPN90096.1 reductase [Pseudomonas nunensis]MCL5225010.1 bifunctional nitrate reductase/sulfite reductase flavoprotein subunit alpha [Pseudomonas nunensis]UTO16336.1 bifunctional nitrate reductase/sulfite reductase flavoprotein subunit alpha [Pseudomonas nunensis]
MTNTSVRSVCPYCGVGCGIVMQVADNRVIKVTGDKTHPTNFGRLCTKGTTCGQAIAESGRMENAYLRHERDRDPVRIAMDQAISETASRLRAILDAHDPDALAFYVSGQMSLEAQYLINKLAKGFVRTNNIESNSRLCMASAGSGYKLSLGSDGPPGSYEDFDHADLFFVIGANMADCHPILFLRMMDRVKAGAKLIVVDPRRSATADKAGLFLQIKPGTDLALLNGLLHLLVKNGHTDPDFIASFTEGWDVMPAFLEDYPPASVAEITGIPEADIRQAAEWIGQAAEWMSCWTMGLNQSTHGTWNTNALCNLHLATGAICRPGSGPFSLTGQPNAMGGREMGYMGPGLPGQRSALVEADRLFIEDLWRLPQDSLPRKVGGGTVAMFEQMSAGQIKACWIICTNPVASGPNRQKVIEGLQAAELVISQDAFLDTETNRYADILLPGALWAEAEGVMINSERNLTLMQKAVEPPGETLADWQIIARVACEMGFAEAFTYTCASEVFEEIKQAWNPKTGYDIRGASYARLRDQPLQWPCATGEAADRNPIRYLNNGVSQTLKVDTDGRQPTIVFATEHGKGIFLPRPHMSPAEMPGEDFPFVLNTGRLQHQWHTLTKTGKVATLNKLNPGPFVELHPEDAASLGIKDKDHVEVRSVRGRAVLPAVVTDRVRQGNCFAPFHWNDVFGANLAINAVTNDAVDPISLQPEFKFCAVVLQRVELIEHSFLDVPTPVANEIPHLSEELPMSRIEAFADLAGISRVPSPQLSDSERTYLAGFLSGLQSPAGRQAVGVPTLPANAPLAADSRLWLDGLLGGLFSRIESSTPQLNPDSGPSVTLLWASQTGNAEALAERFAARLRDGGITVELSAMADFPASKLASTHTLALISSTFGDGDPPDNGEGFWHTLKTAETRLESLRFAVLALGDPNYDQFCKHGKQLDQRLQELGATRLLERVDCDTEFEERAEAWLSQFQQTLKPATPSIVVGPIETPGKAKPHASRLLINRHLNQQSRHKETRMFSLDLADSGLSYEAGDALGVMPRNCPELVDELLDLTRLGADTPVNLDKLGEVALHQALTEHLEIARPNLDTLAFIAERSANPALKHLLGSERKADLKDWLWGRQLADVLQEFPIDCSAQELLGTLKRLQPRLYSIASSSKAHPQEVHLTVAAVRYGKRKGVSSTFLADRLENGEVPIFVQPSKHFRAPADGNLPMIMIGPGTGVAPFRAFLQERRARGDQGRNWLFFGEQHAATDFYYRDELQGMQHDGLLTQLSLAFSRDQPEKIYVQDHIREQGAELWRWLQEGAQVYICGDAGHMAKDVDQALRQVAQRHGGLSQENAADYWRQMGEQKRYLRDVY